MLSSIISKPGFLVAAVRSGRPVFAEGFMSHVDTAEEAAQVAEVWEAIGETVKVYQLTEVGGVR